MNDPPRGARRRPIARPAPPPKLRDELEAEFGEGNVFDTRDLARAFVVLGYETPLVVVRRKQDHALGTLRVQDGPRLYFDFTATGSEHGRAQHHRGPMTMAEPHPPCSTTLRDAHPDHDAKVRVRLAVSPNGVSLYAEGYGDQTSAEGHGTPVFLELYKGELRLVVWSDINKEDPTHIIPLGGARLKRPQPDDSE